jgi:hypothetical protein
MNAERRKVLEGAAKELAAIIKEIGSNDFSSWVEKLTALKDTIEGVKDEEEESYENLSDGLKAAERGSRMQEVASELEDAMGQIDEVIEMIDGASAWVETLDEALGKIESSKD